MGRATYLGGSTIIRGDKGSPPTRGQKKPLSSVKIPKREAQFLLSVIEGGYSNKQIPLGSRQKEIEAAGGLEAWIRRNPVRNHFFQFHLQLSKPRTARSKKVR